MEYNPPLQPATLIKRYKRFLADVVLPNGETITVHCPNPGAMTGLQAHGSKIWLQPALPGRKLPYKWELIETSDGIVGINTQRPNTLLAEALAHQQIPELQAYQTIRSEVTYHEKSRIDFLLSEPGQADCYVEVKNVHLRRDHNARGQGKAEFPDSVTKRGLKHLNALTDMMKQGQRAVLFYVIQRMDCTHISVAKDIDPEYARALDIAVTAGLEILAYKCQIDQNQLHLSTKVRYQTDI